MFEFFRNSHEGEQERLHEYEERKAARKQFLQSFRPGVIRDELLRDALGLSPDDENQDSKLPWLWSMLEWGYPPGWFSEEDPKSAVLARIEGEDNWMDKTYACQVFDNPVHVDIEETSYAMPQGVVEDTESVPALSEIEKPLRGKRWAHYQTELFSSEHLTVYSGKILPPLSGNDDLADQTERKTVPPWRRPGAFSAFGPAGWCELVNHQDGQFRRMHRTVNSVFDKTGSNTMATADNSDMELSD
jgi:zinc finger CCHC domain-containing protein 8